MNYYEEFETLQRNIPYSMFFVLHWFRMIFVWCHKTFIKPIENFLHPNIREEPTEDTWVQVYTMTSNFRSSEKYTYPYTTDLLKFVLNEFTFFIENPIKLKEDVQNESLFIVRIDNQYIVKSFPACYQNDWTEIPKLSTISFSFIEYCHPKMVKPLEIFLPSDFYTIGNELFTPAFVLRQLELMNCYFIFDNDYEIHFIDHDIVEKHLKFNEYIVIEENGYKTILKEEEEDEEEEEEEEVEVNGDSSYWWNFF
jgi:hypothetical protein